jgi:hypothetical protein
MRKRVSGQRTCKGGIWCRYSILNRSRRVRLDSGSRVGEKMGGKLKRSERRTNLVAEPSVAQTDEALEGILEVIR